MQCKSAKRLNIDTWNSAVDIAFWKRLQIKKYIHYILDSPIVPFLELPYALNPPALGFLGLVAPKLVAQY